MKMFCGSGVSTVTCNGQLSAKRHAIDVPRH